LWRELNDAFEYEPSDLPLVEKCCRTLDDVDRIEAELVDAPLMLPGSTGQLRANPLLAEVRAMRALYGQLYDRVTPAPVDDPATAGGRGWTTSDSARLAARARWSGGAR
jgi:hypothetical protein